MPVYNFVVMKILGGNALVYYTKVRLLLNTNTSLFIRYILSTASKIKELFRECYVTCPS